MGKRLPNHRLVKMHRSYKVEDIASSFCVHKNTVRQWIRAGLRTIDEKRPMLIQGRQLIEFLQTRRSSKKRPCQPGEIYCVSCHAPKLPQAGTAEYLPFNDKIGNLAGICPDCRCKIYRCVSMAKLSHALGMIDVTFHAIGR